MQFLFGREGQRPVTKLSRCLKCPIIWTTACDAPSLLPYSAETKCCQVYRPLTWKILPPVSIRGPQWWSSRCVVLMGFQLLVSLLAHTNKMLSQQPGQFFRPKIFASVLISQGRWTFSISIGRKVFLVQVDHPCCLHSARRSSYFAFFLSWVSAHLSYHTVVLTDDLSFFGPINYVWPQVNCHCPLSSAWSSIPHLSDCLGLLFLCPSVTNWINTPDFSFERSLFIYVCII